MNIELPGARRVRLLHFALVAIAAAHAAWPLFRDPDLGWPLAPARRLGLGVVLLGLIPYVVRWKQKRRLTLGAADLVLVLASPLYLLFIGNGIQLTSGDNNATRALGPAIVQGRGLDVSAYPPFDTPPLQYSAMRVGRHVWPAMPLGTGLLTVPYAAVAVAATHGRVDEALLGRWEKHAAALLATAAAVLFFLAIRQRFGQRTAMAATAVLVLATPFLSNVTQALYSTTGEVLFICAALALVLPEDASPVRHALSGIAMGAAFLCRPTALIAALAIGAALLPRGRRAALFLLSWFVAVAATCAFLYALYAHPLGGYGLANQHAGMWRFSPASLAGVLTSPSRGLLVFFPWLLALPFVLKGAMLGRDDFRWLWCSVACVAGLVLLAAGYAKWWGGHALGPRLMTEAAPFLALAAVPALRRPIQPRPLRALFLAALAFAAATQLLMTYRTVGARWNDAPEVDDHTERLWSIPGSQLAAVWGCQRN